MKSLNALETFGTTLTIVGSFLPWERAGGFLNIPTHGIRVDIANFKYWATGIHVFPVYDYGGVIVILLTSVILILVHKPPKFIKNPILLNLIISALLMASSLFFIARWLFHLYEYGGAIGGPTLGIGLIWVVCGAAIFVRQAILAHQKSSNTGYKA